MSIQITVEQKGLRASVLQALLKKQYPKAIITVRRESEGTSRADRFSQAQSDVCDAKSEAEQLKAELEEWQSNMPENLQEGTKAQEIEEAMEQLDEFISACEDAESVSVDFPGMF